jgi:hypothetical protein
MARIRKDTVKKQIENGKMEGRLSYSYDGRNVNSSPDFIPARMYDGDWDNRIEGSLNLNERLYGMWKAWTNPKDSSLITLQTADVYYELRSIS